MWVQMWCASKINFMFESILRQLLWKYLTTVLSSRVASLVLRQDTATSWAPPLGRFLSFWNGQVRLFILPLQKYFKKSFKNQTVENLIFYQNSFWLHQIHLLCSVQIFSVQGVLLTRDPTPPHPPTRLSVSVCPSSLSGEVGEVLQPPALLQVQSGLRGAQRWTGGLPSPWTLVPHRQPEERGHAGKVSPMEPSSFRGKLSIKTICYINLIKSAA